MSTVLRNVAYGTGIKFDFSHSIQSDNCRGETGLLACALPDRLVESDWFSFDGEIETVLNYQLQIGWSELIIASNL